MMTDRVRCTCEWVLYAVKELAGRCGQPGPFDGNVEVTTRLGALGTGIARSRGQVRTALVHLEKEGRLSWRGRRGWKGGLVVVLSRHEMAKANRRPRSTGLREVA
jgi:hypothetical protein